MGESPGSRMAGRGRHWDHSSAGHPSDSSTPSFLPSLPPREPSPRRMKLSRALALAATVALAAAWGSAATEAPVPHTVVHVVHTTPAPAAAQAPAPAPKGPMGVQTVTTTTVTTRKEFTDADLARASEGGAEESAAGDDSDDEEDESSSEQQRYAHTVVRSVRHPGGHTETTTHSFVGAAGAKGPAMPAVEQHAAAPAACGGSPCPPSPCGDKPCSSGKTFVLAREEPEVTRERQAGCPQSVDGALKKLDAFISNVKGAALNPATC